MSENLKINTSVIREKNNPSYADFNRTLINKGRALPVYLGIKTELDALEVKLIPYETAVALSNTDGGKDRTAQTKALRKTVNVELKKVIAKVEELAPLEPEPEVYIVGLGFTVTVPPSRRTGTVVPPDFKSWKSGGAKGIKEKGTGRGNVAVVLAAQYADEIRLVEGKYSADNGATWILLPPQVKLIFTLEGLPSGKDVLIMFRFQASNNRVSKWCEQETVGVY